MKCSNKSEPALVQLPLRGKSPLATLQTWPPKAETEYPRALKSLSKIIEDDLCHRCGSCVGICPTGVLALDKDEYPRIKDLSACTDCDLCVKVCPGDSFDHDSFAKQLFGAVPEHGSMHGHFEGAYLAHSSDTPLRREGTSGGLVTALLLYLLEQHIIDGALVVGSDELDKWKGRPMIARSADELLSSLKSKYAIAPTNVAYEEIREVPGRYAVVGLPCQIHGLHNASRLDKRIKERVVLSIGLFCHAAVEHEPMRILWESLGEDRKNISRFISRVGKHPGTPYLEFKDGSTRPLYFPNATGYRPSSMEILNILYRLYTPARCLTCYDSTSEFADIAVGDPWMPKPGRGINFTDGYSFALARTKRGMAALRAAKRAEVIDLRQLDPDIARSSNTMMGEEKRWRAFRIIETQRRQGKSVPEYGFTIPTPSGKQFILTECNILTHIFCFIRRGRSVLFRLVFTKFGYSVLWVNHYRRNFRDLRRNVVAKCLRIFRGASIIEESTGAGETDSGVADMVVAHDFNAELPKSRNGSIASASKEATADHQERRTNSEPHK